VKLILILTYLLMTVITYWLRQINLRHLQVHGCTIPPGFESAVTPETLAKSTAYTLDSSRLGLWESLFDNVLLLLFLFGGLLPLYGQFIAGMTTSFILQGVLFFLLLTWLQTLLAVPFSLYSTFVVEARHGFNTMTLRLWLSDLFKAQGIGSLLLAVVITVTFGLIQWAPQRWWLWAWAFMAAFSLFMMVLSPYVIEPFFNHFEPVTEEGLEDEIKVVMAKAGLKVSRVMQMDASKRSRHSNAYFTGIGRVKRIVLYDTLIKQMTHAEIIAVLAHEVGHWKLRHVLKRLFVVEALLLGGSWLAFKLLQWEGLPGLIGLNDASLAAQLVILGFIASLGLFPFTPLTSWLSRRDEYAADRFACQITGKPEALATALIKLSAENLANLHPHPFYAWFYYSHPPVVERVRMLREGA